MMTLTHHDKSSSALGEKRPNFLTPKNREETWLVVLFPIYGKSWNSCSKPPTSDMWRCSHLVQVEKCRISHGWGGITWPLIPNTTSENQSRIVKRPHLLVFMGYVYSEISPNHAFSWGEHDAHQDSESPSQLSCLAWPRSVAQCWGHQLCHQAYPECRHPAGASCTGSSSASCRGSSANGERSRMWNSKHRKAKHSSGVENRCGRSSVAHPVSVFYNYNL